MNDRNRNTDTNEIDIRRKPLWYSGRYFDYPLLGIVLGLVLFGLVMVYSTSSYRADELYGDSTYFAKRQLVFLNLLHCLECFWYRRSIIADMQDIPNIFCMWQWHFFSAGLHYR